MKSEHDSIHSQGGLLTREPEGPIASHRSSAPAPLRVDGFSAASDKELLRRFLDWNDEKSFSSLVSRYRTMVIATATRKGVSLETAQEVAQDIFSTLARKAHTLADRETLGGWLHLAAAFQALRAQESEGRRSRREQRFAASNLVSDTNAEEKTGALAVLDDALSDLSPADHELLVLHFFQEMEYPELASLLGANEAAIRQRVSRALGRLEKHLRARGVRRSAVSVLLAAVAAQNGTTTAGAVLAGAFLIGAGKTATTLITSVAALGPAFTKAAAMVALATTLSAVVYVSVDRPPPAPLQVVRNSVVENREGGELSTGSREARFVPATARAATQKRALVAVAPRTLEALRSEPMASTAPALPTQSPVAPSTGQPGPTRQRPEPVGKTSAPTAEIPADKVAVDLPETLANLEREGGIQAVLDKLQTAELFPDVATELYQNLLSEVLGLHPLEESIVGTILNDHFTNLLDQGLAGFPPVDVPLLDWVEQRAPLVADLGEKLEDALATVPVPGLEPIATETIPQVLNLADDLLTNKLPELANAVQPALEPVTGTTESLGIGDPVGEVLGTVGDKVGQVTDITEALGLRRKR